VACVVRVIRGYRKTTRYKCGRAIKPVRPPSGTKAFIGHFSFVICH
jgi:hypothetical protein